MKSKSLLEGSLAMLFGLSVGFNTSANGWPNMSCFSHIPINPISLSEAQSRAHLPGLLVLARSELNHFLIRLNQPLKKMPMNFKMKTMLTRLQALVSLPILLAG